MKRSFVYLRRYSWLNDSWPLAVNSRCMSMARRQNSIYPSSIYPRLQSVDLQDDGPPTPPNKNSEISAEIDFENHVDAFRNKTTWEIVRALTVLKMCSVNAIVDNSLAMMRWVDRVCGRRMLRILFKPTFYNQFVGGETTDEIRSCVRRLAETNMRAMLAATMEEDIGEGGDENVYQNNCQRILESIEIATAEDTRSPMIQLKLSGLLPADLLVILGNRYSSSHDKVKLIKAISHGLSGNEIDVSPFLDIIDEKKREHLTRAVKRLKTISLEAKNRGVKVLVDAEYTYLNPGLSLLTLAAVCAFNQEWPVIWNTYQCYLKDAQQKVDDESGVVLNDFKAYFGAKVVRGAYMVQERSRAEKLQIADPVCEDYDATGKNYNNIISQLLKKTSDIGSRCQFIVASHNEESIKLVLKRMYDLNIDKERGGVCFGQLYGMCDQVTNPLANAGYAVYKSIPFGTVDEVLPYLARRAIENQSVLEGARKEKTLLNKELRRRIGRKLTFRRSTSSVNSARPGG